MYIFVSLIGGLLIQTGKYGKINKCITFPDMLDMIPFMTGNSDSPPLYMLYGVVVHLDTLNASFSGHYVSYVKDLQGTWFRIDDTEVTFISTGIFVAWSLLLAFCALFYISIFYFLFFIFFRSISSRAMGQF